MTVLHRRGTIAITGGTGFVGRTLIRMAVDAGWNVRALTRRAVQAGDGIHWVPGSLDDPQSLIALAQGADVVIHVAGVTTSTTEAGFERGNVTGTAHMIAAAQAQGVRRFIHVSSLTARSPEISRYGASKARSEALVQASGLDWSIVRPPGVYGPGDVDHLELFRAARHHVIPLPLRGRLSIIHVADLARLLLALAESEAAGEILEPGDGRIEGWSHPEFARAIGRAVGRRIIPVPLPRWLMAVGATLDGLIRGEKARLTPDRVSYFAHPDWVVDPDKCPDPARWQAVIPTEKGLADTARHYREAGLLGR